MLAIFCLTLYTHIRASLAESVIQILLKYNLNQLGNEPELYLYGDHAISLDDNKNILLATIKYLKDTKRF